MYSRKSIPKADQDSGCSYQDFWNREHVCPKSICGVSTSPAGPGIDIHSLRAEDKSVNTQRSNKDFFEGGTAVPDCDQCFETSETFEPPDVTKGDAARSIFYMSTRYINDIEIIDGDGSETGSNSIGDRATLELWNDIGTVDAEEIHRNNIIFKIQGNRNPYIDNSAWVDLISW
jgi:endonuclease I